MAKLKFLLLLGWAAPKAIGAAAAAANVWGGGGGAMERDKTCAVLGCGAPA